MRKAEGRCNHDAKQPQQPNFNTSITEPSRSIHSPLTFHILLRYSLNLKWIQLEYINVKSGIVFLDIFTNSLKKR